MRVTQPLLPVVLSAALASASHINNLNYRSFSSHPNHAHHAVDVSRLAKRGDPIPIIDSGAFSSGIASGDPEKDSVVLWTRFAPCGDAQSASSDDDKAITDAGAKEYAWPTYSNRGRVDTGDDNKMACVKYKIWKKDGGSESAAKFGDEIYTSQEVDWTVKVIPTSLADFTQYNYRFYQCGKETEVMTEIGTTKTLPTETSVPKEGLKFNVYTCANWPWGFFNSYATPAKKQRQPDYVLHLGDYIYESPKHYYYSKTYSESIGRLHDNDLGLMSLRDFRNRYRLYRTDSSLQLSHASFPHIAVWDDHEMGDNAWNDGMTNWNVNSLYPTASKPSYKKVKENSVRAYYEWMPIRQQEYENNLRIWRSFQMGGLVDLLMVDTREYDRDVTMYTNGGNLRDVLKVLNDPDPLNAKPGERNRTIMGADQEQWFLDSVSKSTARWQLIGNQIIMSAFGTDYDKWQGYPSTRANVLKSIKDPAKNVVILSGDSHMNWAFDVREVDAKSKYVSDYNPATGDGAIAVEFAVTGVSSPGLSGDIDFSDIPKQNDNAQGYTKDGKDGLLWRESWYRGYMEVDVTTDLVTTRMVGTPCMKNTNNIERVIAEFEVEHGKHKLKRQGSSGIVSKDGGVAAGGIFGGGIVNATRYDILDMSKSPPAPFDKSLGWNDICGANGKFKPAKSSAGCPAS